MSPWLLRSYTAHMALGSVLLYRMTSMSEVHHGHDAYPHTTGCVSIGPALGHIEHWNATFRIKAH